MFALPVFVCLLGNWPCNLLVSVLMRWTHCEGRVLFQKCLPKLLPHVQQLRKRPQFINSQTPFVMVKLFVTSRKGNGGWGNQLVLEDLERFTQVVWCLLIFAIFSLIPALIFPASDNIDKPVNASDAPYVIKIVSDHNFLLLQFN